MNVSAGYPVRNGTVGYWKFDEGSGNIAHDSSGFGNDGTIYGATWTTGQVGKALSFDNDYVEVNNIAVNTTTKAQNTVEFWMYWKGGNNQMPFGWQQRYDLWLYDGCFGFNTGESNIYGIPSSDLSNRWVHVAGIFYNGVPSSTNNALYINGVKQDIKPCIGITTASRSVTSTAHISGWAYKTGYYFGGLIDEVRILNRPLTQEEILEDYKATKDLFITTDKTNYSLGDVVSVNIGLNYSKDKPLVYSIFKLELIEPTGNPDILMQTPVFSLTPGFTKSKTLNYVIPYSIFVPDGEYEFKATLKDTLGNLIDSDTTKIYINDTMNIMTDFN